MVFSVVQIVSILVAVGNLVTILWTKGLDDTITITGTQTKSVKFKATGNDVAIIDNAKFIFHATKDIIIDTLTLVSIVGQNIVNVGYGPNQDSATGIKDLFTINVPGAGSVVIPRKIFLPAGNYLNITRVSGGGTTVGFLTTTSISETVDAESNLNDGIDGAAP